MKTPTIIFTIIILSLVTFFTYQNNQSNQNDQNDQNNKIISDILTIGQIEFEIEIAKTDEERSKGLSGRDYIPENFGLLFVFEKQDKYGIWMKDMKFAIDILWISEGGKVVSVEKNVLPETFPEVFYPISKARYVLELNAGMFDKGKIKVGDIIVF